MLGFEACHKLLFPSVIFNIWENIYDFFLKINKSWRVLELYLSFLLGEVKTLSWNILFVVVNDDSWSITPTNRGEWMQFRLYSLSWRRRNTILRVTLDDNRVTTHCKENAIKTWSKSRGEEKVPWSMRAKTLK